GEDRIVRAQVELGKRARHGVERGPRELRPGIGRRAFRVAGIRAVDEEAVGDRRGRRGGRRGRGVERRPGAGRAAIGAKRRARRDERRGGEKLSEHCPPTELFHLPTPRWKVCGLPTPRLRVCAVAPYALTRNLRSAPAAAEGSAPARTSR